MMNNVMSSFFHHTHGTSRATLRHLARIDYSNRKLDAALWIYPDWRKVRGKEVITSMIRAMRVQGNFGDQ
jgi:GT2 family glycosyltransferase